MQQSNEIPATQSANRTTTARRCRLTRPVRDRQGRSRFAERPQILREIDNLDRHMYLVRFDDGATTLLFPNELSLVED